MVEPRKRSSLRDDVELYQAIARIEEDIKHIDKKLNNICTKEDKIIERVTCLEKFKAKCIGIGIVITGIISVGAAIFSIDLIG